MPTGASDRFVLLRGGLATPMEPVLLLLELEDRGFHVAREGADLLVGPQGRLTDDDCRRISRWKLQLLALIDYRPPTLRSPQAEEETP